MKKVSERFCVFVFLFLISTRPFSVSGSNDTIRNFPFVEDWSSLSFDTNGWTFPWGQGNWSISSGLGYPAPCATFTGSPSNSNYIYALSSTVFDASALTCDDIYLKFDLQLSALNLNGLEKIIVYAMHDSTEDLLISIRNFDNISWHTYETRIPTSSERVFRIRFEAVGQYSPDIESWALDNIIVERRCMIVSFKDISSSGYCNYSNPSCISLLTWGKPTCTEPEGTLYEYIFDDGSAEYGHPPGPGNTTSWLGNEFPIPDWTEGIIQSFDAWFGFGTSTADSLTLDVFDATQQIIGSSSAFVTENNDWVTIHCNIPFHGIFYAMVKWEALSQTNKLGLDDNGTFSQDDLEWYFDGFTWDKISNFGYNPGVFLLRANVLVDGKKATVSPGGVSFENSDSTSIAGYNIYRKDEMFPYDSIYHLVGYVPAPDTVFLDTFSCVAFYNVTCVYSNNCESEPLSFGMVGCWSKVPENSKGATVRIMPNPANDLIRLDADESFDKVVLYDNLGRNIQEWDHPGSKTQTIDSSGLPGGFYLVTIRSANYIATGKLIIQR